MYTQSKQYLEEQYRNAKLADAALDGFDNTGAAAKSYDFTKYTPAGMGQVLTFKPEPTDAKLKPQAEFAHNHQDLEEKMGCHTCQAKATIARLNGTEAKPVTVCPVCSNRVDGPFSDGVTYFCYNTDCKTAYFVPVAPEPEPVKSSGASANQMYRSMVDTFDKCLSICERKCHDYASGENPYRNFETVTRIGVTVQQGILMRTLDKITRLENLLTVAPYVTEETFEDTIDDAINYLAILKARREFERSTK